MRIIIQTVLLLFVTFFISCSNTAQTSGNLTPDEFDKGMTAKPVQLLDVRTAGEYRSNHIKGALQADWMNDTEFAERTVHLDKNKPVFVYCQSGVRASDAAKYLREKGFKEVVNLKGGLSAWRKSGKAVDAGETSKVQTTREEFTTQTISANLVLVDFGAEWCPPCKKMEPVLSAFIQEQGEKVKLVKMDGGNEIELMKALKVDGLPTFILYSNGQETKRKQGVMTKEELEDWVK